MLSFKHYIQLIAIILLLSVMFLYLNVSSGMDISEESVNLKLEIKEHMEGGGQTAEKAPAYYVVFSGGDAVEQAVYENVCLFMEQMKLPYTAKRYVLEGELAPGIALIFCNTKISEGIQAEVLGSFIRQGGKALFAAGIPEGYTDSYLSPLWGIVEKGNRVESEEWKVQGDFFPSEAVEVLYPGFQASTRIKLSDAAEIYIEDEKEGLPIVYKNGYGEGSSLMINGTLMESRYSGGIFAAALGALEGELLYPVIGQTVVFLDDFPFVLPGYDRNSISLYGRSMESFERDVLWPVFVSYASNYGIRYTMNLCERQEDYDEGLLNEKLLTYLIKENLRYDGEIMASKYYGKDGKSVKDAVEKVFMQHFPNYDIQAFAALSGKNEEARALIERGIYSDSSEAGKSRGFAWDGRRVTFPVITNGYAFEDISYAYLAGITLHGVISHSLPVSGMITADTQEQSYEGVKKELGSLLEGFGAERRWLEGATVSEAAQRVINYSLLQTDIVYGPDRIEASFSGFTQGQKLLLRSGRGIRAVEGGRAYRINEHYYCIEADKPELTVLFLR